MAPHAHHGSPCPPSSNSPSSTNHLRQRHKRPPLLLNLRRLLLLFTTIVPTLIILSTLQLPTTPALAQATKCGSAHADWLACGYIVDTGANLDTGRGIEDVGDSRGGGAGGGGEGIYSDGDSIDFDNTGVIPNPEDIGRSRRRRQMSVATLTLWRRQEDLVVDDGILSGTQKKVYFCCSPVAECRVARAGGTACFDVGTGQYVLSNRTSGDVDDDEKAGKESVVTKEMFVDVSVPGEEILRGGGGRVRVGGGERAVWGMMVGGLGILWGIGVGGWL